MKTSVYTHFEQTIIDNITLEDYTDKEMTLLEKIKFVFETFKSEYLHNGNRHLPITSEFTGWLQGLPSILTVPFYNHAILENAKAYGYTFENEEEEDNFLENYFLNCARAFYTLKGNL